MKYTISGLIIFSILSFIVSLAFLNAFDLQFTQGIQKIIPPLFTTPFSLFSFIGSAEFAGIILLILLLFIHKLNKISVLFLFGLFSIIEVVGKSLIGQKAPPIEFLRTDLHFFLPISSAVPKEFFSYPSGHAARTAFISGIILVLIWNSKLKRNQKYLYSGFVIVFDLIMFVSRVYLGEHWLSDVVGGVLLGFSFSLISPKILIKKG